MEEIEKMINQNYEKLVQLKMDKMAELYLSQSNIKKYNELPFDERMAILIDAEIEDKRNKSIEAMRRSATIKHPQANINDIEFMPDRKIDKALTLQLHECDFVRERLNVIIIGATGAGKTYYASSLANSAIDHGIKTKYLRLPDLLYDLNVARETPKTFKRKLNYLGRVELLIIDDWLLTELDEQQLSDIFEVLELRNESKSTILASQFDTSGWYEKLGSGAVADAIMDRIIHNSYIVKISGNKSMRERKSKIK